ncbi:MAG: hypothetical protein PHE61_03260 [Candidatus Omnitrophica bacterium]|nr:hypothetical protein [Candidatus Omnitrophota bacterium]
MKRILIVSVLFFILANFILVAQAMAAADTPDSSKGGFSNAEIDERQAVGECPSEEHPGGNIPDPDNMEGDGYYDDNGTFHNY